MSADAESAYGQAWFQRGATSSEPQSVLDPSSPQLKKPSLDSHPTPHQHTESAQRRYSVPSPLPGAPAAGRSAMAQVAAAEPVSAVTGELPSALRTLQLRLQQTLGDQITPLRLASHLSVLLVAGAVLLFSRMQIPEWDFQLVAMPTSQPATAGFDSVTERMKQLLTNSAGAVATADELQPQIVPFTIIPESTRQVIQIYSVASGDTVLGIAQKFGLNPETLQWSNPDLEANPDLLRVGDQVKILPLNGVLHTVKGGDTLSELATTYKVSAEEIIAYESNNLADINSSLIIGSDLVIPGGEKPYARPDYTTAGNAVPVPAGAAAGSGNFSWPTAGSISQSYWGGHPAIDMASYTGAAVKAADGGFVTLAGGGWNGGYGNHVIIDHGNGFTTLYAHLNSIFVSSGESVAAGQQIGTVGNTGNSTGPHLHFEIRYNGYAYNPNNYLR